MSFHYHRIVVLVGGSCRSVGDLDDRGGLLFVEQVIMDVLEGQGHDRERGGGIHHFVERCLL